MDTATTPSGGVGRAFGRLVITLVVLALVGTVAMLLGQLNARTYMIQKKGDELVVMKGRQMPYGVAPFTPDDPALAETYAPIPLEGREPNSLLMGAKFEDRDALDKALFKVLEELARLRAESDDPKTIGKAIYYVRRASRLRGLTDEQRASLAQLEAQVAYFQAKSKLDEARQLATDSVDLLRIAARSQSKDARQALALLAEIEPLARGLERILGRATQLLGGPVMPDYAPEPQVTAPRANPATPPMPPPAPAAMAPPPPPPPPAPPPAQMEPHSPPPAPAAAAPEAPETQAQVTRPPAAQAETPPEKPVRRPAPKPAPAPAPPAEAPKQAPPGSDPVRTP